MWYILLNRVVVMRTQQGLAPLLIILHLEVIRGLCTDMAYGNTHKSLKENGSSKASKQMPVHGYGATLITRYCQDKGYSVSTERGVTFGSVSRKLA